MELKQNIIKVLVKTNMPKTEILGFDKEKDAYKLNVHAQPEKGKANIEIIKFFRKEFKKDIEIISGKTSSHKVIKVL